MKRLLILCTANSARSQMAEGWTRHFAARRGLNLEVHSAGLRATRVNPQAVEAMREVGIDLSGHTSKALTDLPDPWNFDLVVTVCDSANEACPNYPARTTRRHYSFEDPAGQPDEPAAFRRVRDAERPVFEALVEALAAGREAPPDQL
ncbi:MAG TPA: arsenate reductase ArsC [Deinococcales bacterium]|nr:arsenate reductase ArsC [Deinococcales bacterium]